jgi:hypothetical protein
MEKIIIDLKNKKNGEKYHDLVIDDTISHLEKAQECMCEGMLNPKKWHEDNIIISKTFLDAFPQLYLLQQFHTPKHRVGPEEN